MPRLSVRSRLLRDAGRKTKCAGRGEGPGRHRGNVRISQRAYAHARAKPSQQQLELSADDELLLVAGQHADARFVIRRAVRQVRRVDRELGRVTVEVTVQADRKLV